VRCTGRPESGKRRSWICSLSTLSLGGASTASREIMIHASLLRYLIRTKHTPPLQPLRAFATHNSTHWPRIATRNCYRRSLQPRTTTRTMASIHIDDKVKALINNSYPQTQDAGDDPHKLSTIAYPHVEVRSRDFLAHMDMQLTITTVHPA
jgi:hypothetical protein